MTTTNSKPTNTNPLQKYFRQPKIFITLPSNGEFYPPGDLDMPETGEFPVYPMTAKDELLMKTPDALLNGQATVDVIKSCIPHIKNPWNMPSIDLDAVLIGIRIATYGEMMSIETKVPGLSEERSFSVDLRKLLNKLVTASFNGIITINDMTIHIKPLTYKEFTETSLKTFEEQRVFALVNNTEISDTEKLAQFNESFKKLTNLTINTVSHSIFKIVLGDVEVTNSEHIEEFMNNSDKSFYKAIVDHIDTQREKFQIEPLKVKFPKEDIELGAPEDFEIPITFDQSNFFA